MISCSLIVAALMMRLSGCVPSVTVEFAGRRAALHRIMLDQHGGASQDRLAAERQRLSRFAVRLAHHLAKQHVRTRRPMIQSKRGFLAR